MCNLQKRFLLKIEKSREGSKEVRKKENILFFYKDETVSLPFYIVGYNLCLIKLSQVQALKLL